ncbi:MAG: sigma 54-interacting transcriptional regulator, partial [Rhodoferax sp.]|nr:sigma 54-interacting transcriptional regulator [Rhodoferax sp.]
ERGAFTGAQTLRRGRFEQADGGTLFLDEIGDMPIELQTRLLRVLSDGHFYRVGGHGSIKTHVRVIAATHQNLEQRVRDGAVREDLFHRLNVIRLRLPPLRERTQDIAMLARHFLQQSAEQLGVEPKRLSAAALGWLEGFAFPGNVRQLENLCHWLTVMAPAQVVEAKDLPAEIGVGVGVIPAAKAHALQDLSALPELQEASSHVALPTAAPSQAAQAPDWESALESEAAALLQAGQANVWESLCKRFEARLIQAALSNTKGRRIEAAHKLGIGRNTLTRKIQAMGWTEP